jgi:hypothetical protein
MQERRDEHMLRCCPGNNHVEDCKDQQYKDLFHHRAQLAVRHDHTFEDVKRVGVLMGEQTI